jgi:hypothetical protein
MSSEVKLLNRNRPFAYTLKEEEEEEDDDDYDDGGGGGGGVKFVRQSLSFASSSCL